MRENMSTDGNGVETDARKRVFTEERKSYD